MINALIRITINALLRLRYRIRVHGREAVAARGTTGILFLPNHPALIDPVIVTGSLHAQFQPRPLAVENQINKPGIRWFTRRVGVRPIPDLTADGVGARGQVAAVVDACAESLALGENILLYPAGHLYRSKYEDLRGNSAVELILRKVPDVRIVLVRTRGMWGSSFGFASGVYPNFGRAFRRGVWRVLANLLFFTPRRDVSLELVEPDDFPRNADRSGMNAFMEAFYNQDAPAALHVPYTIWARDERREMPDPQLAAFDSDVSDVPAATRNLVIEHLRELTGEKTIDDQMHLAKDLGLDSLARAELSVWLGREFGFHGADVDALQTVADLMLAARGHASTNRPVDLRPVPPAWFRGASDEAIEIPDGDTIAEVFLRQAARDPHRVAIADQLSGAKTYRDLITAIFALKSAIQRLDGDHVGIMLPASVAADIAYLATMFAGKTPVMVNWTTGARNMIHGLDLTGTRHVLTAGPLVARVESQGTDLGELRARLVLLEPLGGSIGLWTKLAAALRARLSWRSLHRAKISPVATVLFTSGSEALPKAVPLSHTNLLANARDVLRIVNIRRSDAMMGFLPPFHSFGLAINMILPLIAGLRVVHYANPTEGWVIASMIEAYRAGMVVGTPTFLAGIARAARTGQLDSLRLAVTGAEKCPEKTYALLGARCPSTIVLEGYGITECSPIVSANSERDPRPGTIGRMLPSVEHAIVDVETNTRVAAGEQGMLLVRGPSIFEGYIGDAPSPFVDFDGQSWYRTGDLVREGKDGVLTFHGRLKRFIKLGGEMISLPAIESVLQQHFTSEGHEGPTIAIEATPSEDHPEVVLFTTQPADRAGVNRMIRDAGLSGLHNVSRVILVDEIPVLGTGKTDYRALEQQLADADGETTESTQHA